MGLFQTVISGLIYFQIQTLSNVNLDKTCPFEKPAILMGCRTNAVLPVMGRRTNGLSEPPLPHTAIAILSNVVFRGWNVFIWRDVI